MELKIALCGGMRVGKDTVKDYAERVFGMTPFAFGDAVKDEFHKEFPHIKRNPKPRTGYQLYSDLKKYVFGDQYWIDKCFSNISFIRDVAKNYKQEWVCEGEPKDIPFRPIITDVRYPEELIRCIQEGYITIKVVSSMNNRVNRIKKERDEFFKENLIHSSEKYIETLNTDYVIENNGTINQLHEKFDKIVRDVLKDSDRHTIIRLD